MHFLDTEMKKTLAFMLAAALAACQTDSYDSGQGNFSLLTADFVELHTDARCAATYAITDGGDSLALVPAAAPSWASRPDTAYRAILYYDRADGPEVRVRSVIEVPVLRPAAAAALDSVPTHPVRLESAWVSAGGKYLNLGLYLKVGEGGPEGARHTVGLVCDSVALSATGCRTAHLRLYHDQGGVPEHYSQKTYVSAPCALLAADSAVLRIETYGGLAVVGLRLSEQ